MKKHLKEALTKRYADLCSHYGLRATCCNPRQSNENRSIESRNNSLLEHEINKREARRIERHRNESGLSWTSDSPALTSQLYPVCPKRRSWH